MRRPPSRGDSLERASRSTATNGVRRRRHRRWRGAGGGGEPYVGYDGRPTLAWVLERSDLYPMPRRPAASKRRTWATLADFAKPCSDYWLRVGCWERSRTSRHKRRISDRRDLVNHPSLSPPDVNSRYFVRLSTSASALLNLCSLVSNGGRPGCSASSATSNFSS